VVVTPTVRNHAANFAAVQPVSYEPDQHPLPDAELGTKPRSTETSDLIFRGLLEADAQCLAAKHTSTANLLDQENGVPSGPHKHPRLKKSTADPASSLRHQLRESTALELRNRSAADALERFFQLADAEARAEVLRQALPMVDQLHDLAAKAKAAGVRAYPIEPDESDRQRSQLQAQIDEAETNIRILNVDLRRRVGLPWAAGERLWPTGSFAVISDALDEDAAVQGALSNRPELQGLRALEAGMTAESLPAVREMLRTINPLLGGSTPKPVAMSPIHTVISRFCADPGDAAAELAQRRQQAHDLRLERERAVSDEARAAAIKLNAQVTRIALVRGRVESLKLKMDEARKQRQANLVGSDLMEAQAKLDWLKARAELVAEAMAWHQARIRLKAAQGLLAMECQ